MLGLDYTRETALQTFTRPCSPTTSAVYNVNVGDKLYGVKGWGEHNGGEIQSGREKRGGDKVCHVPRQRDKMLEILKTGDSKVDEIYKVLARDERNIDKGGG